MLSATERRRFRQQISLPGFGEEGQLRIRDARVLIVGAGGLGCPAALYLAAAGVGVMGIVDGDRVEESNLPRQILYTEADLGRNKAEAAAARLRAHQGSLRVQVYACPLEPENAEELIARHDLVLDCSDNFATRYLVNDHCFWLGRPLVTASVSGWEGQLALLNDPRAATPVNYRDLFPGVPDQALLGACALSGVAGPAAGTMGALQAAMALRYLLGDPALPSGRLCCYQLWTGESRSWEIRPQPGNPLRQQAPEVFRAAAYGERPQAGIIQVSPGQFRGWMQQAQERFQWLDVREERERVWRPGPPALHAPASGLGKALPALEPGRPILVFCSSGRRSLEAIHLLRRRYGNEYTFMNLQGGLAALDAAGAMPAQNLA